MALPAESIDFDADPAMVMRLLRAAKNEHSYLRMLSYCSMPPAVSSESALEMDRVLEEWDRSMSPRIEPAT
ncbi:MAG TPA: hypothetical protein VIA06_17655 [Candidatus Dormibacteraeota bacterium]|jgi:hypothetical protein|nr:hypothetical protein [Candidatus Dormibacteraeota bacterium]